MANSGSTDRKELSKFWPPIMKGRRFFKILQYGFIESEEKIKNAEIKYTKAVWKSSYRNGVLHTGLRDCVRPPVGVRLR